MSAKSYSWAYLQDFGGPSYSAPQSGSCVADGFCAFGATLGSEDPSSHGEVVSSAGPGKPWAVENVAANAGVAVSCPSQDFCVAAGANQPRSGGFLSGVVIVGES